MLWLLGLFWTGVLIGHVAIAVTAINVLYGRGWRRRILKTVRLLHDAWLVFGTPALAWFIWRWGLWEARRLDQAPLLAAYVANCALAGWVVVPAVTIARWLRRMPGCQLSNHSRVVDVAAELGYRPIGHGPKRLLARLPGNDQFRFEVNERAYRLPRLPPAWHGRSILHLSDFHFSGTVAIEYFERLVAESNTLGCDLLVLTGDYIEKPACYDWLPRVLGPLRWRLGAFAVLGNHDWWRDTVRIRGDLERLGIELVAGRWTCREIRGHSLLVAGTEQPWMGQHPDLATAPPDAFRVLLSHTPDCVTWAAEHDIDLMLAGHNHGGQGRLPIIGPVYMPSRYGRRYDMGAFQVGPTLLHVSRGISGAHPLRINCLPEVTKIVLHSGQIADSR